ncbi:MAG: hypothetical protein QQN63_14415, partial [Nitrosopumilus sp.]
GPFIFDLEAFGVEYQVGMEIVGKYPQVDTRKIVLHGEDSGLSHDIYLWVLDQPDHFRMIRDVDLAHSYFTLFPVCLDPLVTALYLMVSNGDDNHDIYLVYASDKVDGVLRHTFLRVENGAGLDQLVFVRGCKLELN